MRFKLVAALLGLVVGLTGCSSQPDVAGPEPQSDATPSEPTRSARPERPKRGPIPAGLRVALPAVRAVPAVDSIVIDLAEAVDAPSVDEAPVEAGMLLAQLNLFSTDDAYETIRSGQPYLMTRAGQWRQFDLARYGFGATTYGELSMTISSDGRDVAFAAPSGLVTVDLRDNTFRRFDLPVHHAVGLEWSSDASTLFLKDRNSHRRPCGPKGCALDLSTGRLSAVPFDLFYSTHGNADVVLELKNATKKQPVHVISHREGMPPTAVSLQYLTSVSTVGGPAAAQEVAYAQCTRSRGVRDTGVVVVDSTSGHAVSMLESTQRPACRLGAQSWLNDRQLLVDDWVSGDMWLWDVTRKRVQHVAVGRTTGVNFSVAGEVMARRFGRSLQP